VTTNPECISEWKRLTRFFTHSESLAAITNFLHELRKLNLGDGKERVYALYERFKSLRIGMKLMTVVFP
jgi:hypothetical protein